MVQLSVQSALHLFAHLFLTGHAFIFGAILTMMLPSQSAAQAARKMVPATTREAK